MASVARQVREYIDNHPSVADALKMDIVNYSALARRIGKELGIRKEEAVLAACRRYPADRLKGYREESVKRVLQKSRVETRTKVATVTVVQGIDVLQRLGDVVEELLDENRICRLIQVSQGTVIIVDEDAVSRVTRKLREGQIISVRRDLIEIAVTSPESIEDTPGLLAFLSTALASRGINIVQAMSCYTDTIFLLEPEDMTAAVDVLTRSLR
ncbi:MAG: ACT domain-containing protein [Euryarchaeota archaeon]|nr:ACT domain-containing protein [Euryarchaeota archaeon]